jgi:hypothetical protein
LKIWVGWRREDQKLKIETEISLSQSVKAFATGRRLLGAAAGVAQAIRRLEGALPPVVASHTSMTGWAFLKKELLG